MSVIEDVLEDHGGQFGRRGGSWYKIKCPYHDDSTPSAVVHPNVQPWGKYHCFVCGIHEDAIGLLQTQGGLTYAEARDKATALAGESGGQVRNQSALSEWLPGRQGNTSRPRSSVPAWRSGLPDSGA